MKKYVVDDIFQHSKEKFYFTKEEITLFEAFAGIGSQHIAMNELAKEFGFKLKVVGISEIDKYAIQSYNAIHGETKNYGSITDIQEIPQVDIFTYSFPCQDISLAGHQKGFTKGSGTRSGLLWEVERLLENQEKISKLPQVLIMENVKSLLSEQFKDDLQEWKDKLESLGYSNFLDVLNAKDYEIPQNRERVFMISILGEYSYFFPIKKKLKLRLKDMLEDEVNEKYYLSDKQIKQISNWKAQQDPLKNAKTKDDKVLQCITAKSNTSMNASMLLIKETDETLCLNSKVNGKQPSLQDRIYDSKGVSTAITTSFMPSVLIEKNINNTNLKKFNKDDIVIFTPVNNGSNVIGNLSGGKWDKINESARRVYNINTHSPTIHTMGGGNTEPKILIPEATKKGYAEATDGDGVYINRPHQKRGVVQKGMIQTIKTTPDIGVVVKGNYSPSNHNASRIVDEQGIAPTVMENHGTVTAVQIQPKDRNYNKKGVKREQQFETRKDDLSNAILTNDNKNMVVKGVYLDQLSRGIMNEAKEGLSTTLKRQVGHNGVIENNLRIRKLTPKECWRLMGFSDSDFEKAEKVCSNSQLYKQAGNSIVVNVLYYIFKQLFKKGEIK